jgi:hypothetical protein
VAKKTTAQLDREIEEALRNPSGKQPLRPARSSNTATLAKAARKANDAIYDFIHHKYFQSVPLDQLFTLVEEAGLSFDPEEKQSILTGRTGKATWSLFDPESGREANHMLVLNWHKMENSGRYEVVAYVS